MALLDRIAVVTAGREAVRADPVTLEEFGALLARGGNPGKSKAGTTVSATRALGITAWYSGARYLSESVAGLPWGLYRRVGADERERRAQPAWMASPDVDQTWYGVVEFAMMSMIHRGDGFLYKLRNMAGQVVGLREIFPDRVTGGIAPDGSKRFLVDRDPTVYSTREVLHIPGLAYTRGRFGINPIQNFAEPLGAIAAADDYSATWFGNNTHLGGIISLPEKLTREQAIATREVWDEFHAGLLNAHKTGVLSAGATYNRVTLSAADAQLLESRQFGVAEVSRMLRIPPHKLYDLTRATFSNIEHQAIEATTDSVRPWVTRFEVAVNNDPDLVPAGHYVEATLEGLLRGDSAAQAASYTAGVNGGWLTPGTVARKQNLPSPPELDYYIRPLNMAVIRPGQDEEIPNEDSTESASALSAAETVQKVYLGVANGVITKAEARQMITEAGGTLAPGVPAELTPKQGGPADG